MALINKTWQNELLFSKHRLADKNLSKHGPSEEVRKKFWEAEKWGTTIFPGNADFSAAGRGTHCL